MRPADAPSADGPMKLFRAAVVAASAQAADRGVMLVMNDRIIGARDLRKADTMTVDAFTSSLFGLMGIVSDRRAHFYRGGLRCHTADSAFDVSGLQSLPRMHIAYGHEDDDRSAIDAFVSAGAQGIVHAGAGTASVSQRVKAAMLDAVARGTEFGDEAHGTVAGDTLSPPKARVLLQLALTQTRVAAAAQRCFDEY